MPKANGGRRHTFFICAALAVLTGGVYFQVVNHRFVSLDDLTYAAENEYVRGGLTWAGVRWAFTTNATANWHPLTWLSLMFDCELFDNASRACHATNAMLHIANTLLLFLVLNMTTRAMWRSAFVAALFALHPLHVESIAWVSERKDVLSTLFWMLTMWAYIGYAAKRSLLRYVPVLILFALGLMAKPMLVTLPCVLLLMDYWPLERFNLAGEAAGRGKRNGVPAGRFDWNRFGALILEKTPLFLLIVISSVITFVVQRSAGVMSSVGRLDMGLRVGNAFWSYLAYIGKMLWPAKLAAFYPYIEVPAWHHILAGVAVVLITVASVVWGRKKRYLLVGWLWYVGTLVPVIGLIQVGMQKMADRYTYIPLIGVFIIISWGTWDILKKFASAKAIATAAAGVTLAALSAATWVQAGTWRNNFTLYEHAIKVTRGNFVAHNNLGAALKLEGRLDEAMDHWEKAIRINPGHRDSASNMGRELVNRERYDEAIAVYNKYLEYEPTDFDMKKRVGDAMLGAGRNEEAIEIYRQVLQSQPLFSEAYYSMGLALARLGKDEEAAAAYTKCLEQDPKSFRAHHNLATVFTRQNNLQEAEKHYREALRLNKDYVSAYCNLAVVLGKQNRISEAKELYEKAIAIEPDNERARKGLEDIAAVQKKTP